MINVFNFSAGETSGYMTIKFYKPGDIVLFCNTTRENPSALEFIKQFEINENIPVIQLQLPGGWDGFLQKWNKGKSLPNRTMRECTLELKVRTARRWCRKNIGMAYNNFIGFRYDEPERVAKHKEKWQRVKTIFPLFQLGITKPMINEYWQAKPYRLFTPGILGNCDLCFMKGKDKIISILTNFPEMADKWIADEESPQNIYGHTYVKGITMREMKEAALFLISKGKVYDLVSLIPEFNCACTA